MSKQQKLNLKIGIGFAISTGIILILGLYIIIAIQPIINYSKFTTLETSDAIGGCTDVIYALKDTTTSFHHYAFTRNIDFYKKVTKNVAKLKATVEYIQRLDENSTTLKILHQQLPLLLNLVSTYEETIFRACAYIQEFEENIPKLSLLISNSISEMDKFLTIPQDFIRSSGGKDAESFNVIININSLINKALIARGDFWRGVSTQETEPFQSCEKILKDSIVFIGNISKKNTVSAFKEPLEALKYSIKNIEQAFLTVEDNYKNFFILQQKHCVLVDEISDILNLIVAENINKLSDESQKVVTSLNRIKYVVLFVLIIGVMFANTVGIIIARQANKDEKQKENNNLL